MGAVLLVVLHADAAGPSAPFLHEASDASKADRVTAECSPPQALNGRWRTHCSFVEVTISDPPTSASIDQEIAGLDAEIAKKGNAVLADACKGVAEAAVENRVPTGSPDVSFAKAMQQACAAKSVSQLRQAFADYLHQVKAHTCHVLTNSWSDDYDQVDANTWISNQPPSGACHASAVLTLWSDPKTPSLWNYKQVTTLSPSADPFCQKIGAGTTEIREFLWSNVRTRDLGCRYFEM